MVGLDLLHGVRWGVDLLHGVRWWVYYMVLDGGSGSITWCKMVGLDLLHGVRW